MENLKMKVPPKFLFLMILGFSLLILWFLGKPWNTINLNYASHHETEYNIKNASSTSMDETKYKIKNASSRSKNETKYNIKNTSSSSTDETIFVEESGATYLYEKIRVICIILTTEKDLSTKLAAVNNTWARRCNKHFFVMTTKLHKADIINSEYADNRMNLIHKVRNAFEFIHDKYIDEVDWVFKTDDDTYAIIENLRFLLSHYNASKPGYLGFIFDKYVTNGYMSGGAGYVISRQGIKQLVQNGIRENKCPVVKTKENPELSEDQEIGRCLASNQVPRLNSHDVYGRDTFHPYPVEKHLFGKLPQYLYSWCKQPPVEGRNCCSQFTITFHYMNPRSILLIDHLLYKTSVFGRTLPKQMGKVIQVGQYRP